MKIYTKTGDKGETFLFNQERVPKNHAIIEALGAIDETNASIGMALALLSDDDSLQTLQNHLEKVQSTLFEIGALVAIPERKINAVELANEITALENWIDQMQTTLPPLHQFILPGGHPGAAALHVARTSCRTTERRLVSLISFSQEILIYFNRLSDALFVAARTVNLLTGTKELIWIPKNKNSSQSP